MLIDRPQLPVCNMLDETDKKDKVAPLAMIQAKLMVNASFPFGTCWMASSRNRGSDPIALAYQT